MGTDSNSAPLTAPNKGILLRGMRCLSPFFAAVLTEMPAEAYRLLKN
jgi:hypothetical protein